MSSLHRYGAIQPPAANRGAVLLTSLLLLLVMTILGLASMSTATMEERMATNSSLRNRSFHAAESAVPEALPAGWGHITSTVCNVAGGTPAVFNVTDLGDAIESSASVCYLAAGEAGNVAAGYSQAVDSPLGVEPHYFEIRATGSIKSGAETLSSTSLSAGVLIPPGG